MLLLAPSACSLFKWRQFEPEVILMAVGWYLRFSLSYRDVEALLAERGHFRSFWGAWRTIAGYEAIHMIRKGQAYGSAAGVKVDLLHRFILGVFAATS